MDLAEQLDRIRAANTDPQALALVTLDIVLATHPPELRRAVEAAVIPHWFDAEILSALLDDDLRRDSARWFQAVIALPAIERFPARSAYNVHEATRLALRRWLATEAPDRFAELSGRASVVFESASVAARIERAFHRLVYTPEEAGPELRDLEFDLRANPEDALAFGRTLWEYAEDESWHPLVRGWSLLMQAVIRQDYVPVQEALSLAERSRASFLRGEAALGEELANLIIGDLLLLRAEPDSAEYALTCYERSLEIAERFYGANPHARAARDVSVSLERLGALHRDRGQSGDALRALACFEKSLRIDERLYEASPQNRQAARDVAISLRHLGDFHQDRGEPHDAELALSFFEKSLEIAERLYEADPHHAQAAQDVAFSLARLGDFHRYRGKSGDAEQALSSFEKSLQIRDRIYVANPQNAFAARAVAVLLERLGDVYRERGQPGDAERALMFFGKSLEIRDRLYEVNPQNAQTAFDVATSLERLGAFHSDSGQGEDVGVALSFLERSLEIRVRLFDANPQNARAARVVCLAHFNLARFHQVQPDSERANQHFAACFAILDSFARAGRPMDPQMRRLHEELKPMFPENG